MTLTLIRRFLIVAAVLALAGGSAFADTIGCKDYLDSTDYSTLQDLINLPTAGYSGCTINDKVFSLFATGFSGGHGSDVGEFGVPTVPANSDVTVTPITSGAYGFTFSFGAHNTVHYDQYIDLTIQYLVTVTDPDYDIASVYTKAAGGRDSNPLDNGTILATKNLCLGSEYYMTAGGDATGTCLGTPVSNVSGENFFDLSSFVYPHALDGTITLPSGQTNLGVYDELYVNGGSYNNGGNTAGISYITNQFNQTYDGGVPEPATMLLIGSALLGLGVLRRKRA